MNLHINNYNGPKVGVSLWIGDTIPKVESACINNNAQYFDKFYLICNKVFDGIDFKVTQLHTENMLGDIFDLVDSDLQELLPKPFKANYASDVMTYFSKSILAKMGINHERVMYLDTDYVIYNSLMLKEIFNYYENQFLLIKENNYYTRFEKDWYINACLSFDSGNNEDTRLRELINFLQMNGNTHYACMGPHFTNREETLRWANILNAEPHTFDPRLVHEGWNEFYMNPNSLGCHLAITLPKELGYYCTDIKLNKPVIKLKFRK